MQGDNGDGPIPDDHVHIYPPLVVLRDRAASRSTVSYSMLSKFDSCPLCWFASYFTDIPQRRTGTQYLGVTIHKVLHDQVAVPYPVEAVPDLYREAWNSQSAWKDRGPTEWHLIDWGAKSLGAMHKQAAFFRETGLKLLEAYFSGPHRGNAPLYLVRGQESVPASELALLPSITQYGGRQLTHLDARIDRVTVDGRILDFKTKAGGEKKALTLRDAQYSMQGVIYAFALEEEGIAKAPFTFQYGQFIYGWSISPYYDSRVKVEIPAWKVDAFRQNVLPERLQAAEEKLDIIMNHPDPGAYFQGHIRPGSHCGWCDVQQSCPWTAGPQEDN